MASNRTLIVGETSFIGKHINHERVSYRDFPNKNLKDYDVVVNCSLNPLYKTHGYRQDIDVDLEIGRLACQSGCHYVMISTSKVYGNSDVLRVYNEFDKINPTDHYSENKVITENLLLGNFSDQVTILRGSNIFGFEYGRNSFVGYCMSQLVNEGQIKLTIDGYTKRDFLYVEDAARIIEKVCEVKPKGIYNLSSNQPISVNTVCGNLVKGYPYGGMILGGGEIERQFSLSNEKLKQALGIEIGPFDFEQIFFELGKKLWKTW